MTRRRLIVVSGVAVALVAAFAFAARAVYFVPAAKKAETLREGRGKLAAVERELEKRHALRARLDGLGGVMIAGATDEFEHRLRSGLAAIARESSLAEVSLGNGRPSPVRSPVLSQRGTSDLGKALRARPDFAVVRGWMTGQGTLEQVMRALASVRAQPWIHRVESFSIKPIGGERQRFELRVDFATVLMDGVEREVVEPWVLAPPSAASLAFAGEVVEASVFGARPQPAPVVAQAPRALGPSPKPYGDWRVTGLIEGRETEALLVNGSTGERLVLEPGQGVLDAVFEDGAGERTVFSIEGTRHEVTVGQTLAERRRTD